MRRENYQKFADPAVLDKLRSLEESKEYQARLTQVKEDMKGTISQAIYMVIAAVLILGLLAPFLDKLVTNLAYYLLIPTGVFIYKKNNELSKKRRESYATSFLEPILQASLPGSQVQYDAGISSPALSKVIPTSSRYYEYNCHITFGDEEKTEFCNLYSYHKETDSEGHTTTVRDFRGQVFLSHFKTDMQGAVRILPSKKGLFGSKSHDYGRKQKKEREIEFEDIFFNEHYTVYCEDEANARRLLNPEILSFLDSWAKELKVAVYWDAQKMLVSFYTNEFVLQSPHWRSQIEALSLTAEYAKVQEGLRRTYQLVDAMSHL